MKKYFLTIVCSLFCINHGSAQIPAIKWQKIYGTAGNEVLHQIIPTADGNYLVMGIADVNGDDVSCDIKGKHDVWVFKMTFSGNIIWQQCFGGSKEEANPYNKIIATSDGGSLFISESWSDDYDAIGHHKYSDVLTVKLDASGNIQWKHSFGGKRYDVPRALLELPGQCYVVVSRSTSSDGDVPANNDPIKFDAWVFILNKYGNIISNHVYGGTGDDDLHQVVLSNDGKLVLFGSTDSSDGDLSGLNTQGTDAWVLTLDTLGNVISSRVFGKQQVEEFYDAVKTNDGGYMAFGITQDPMSPVENGYYHGNDDLWAVKFDHTLAIQWQGIYGGSDRETLMQGIAAPDNGGYYLAGGTYSNDGDVVKPVNNGNDEYVIKIAPDGKLLWAFTHGGTGKDYANSITTSGLVAGVVYSTDGDITNGKGNGDGWIYRFKDYKIINLPKEGQNVTSESQPQSMHVYPNPAIDHLFVEITNHNDVVLLALCDALGKTVFTKKIEKTESESRIEIPLGEMANGFYLLQCSGKNVFETQQVIIAR